MKAQAFIMALPDLSGVLRSYSDNLKHNTQQFAWAIRGYYPKKNCENGTFKSKVQIVADIIDEVHKCIQQPMTVLIDAWYTCAPILKKVIEAQWIFVAAIKQNRKIFVGGKQTRVCHLAKGPRRYETIRHSNKQYLKVAKRVIYLPKIGTVLLFICRYKTATKFIISNDVTM